MPQNFTIIDVLFDFREFSWLKQKLCYVSIQIPSDKVHYAYKCKIIECFLALLSHICILHSWTHLIIVMKIVWLAASTLQNVPNLFSLTTPLKDHNKMWLWLQLRNLDDNRRLDTFGHIWTNLCRKKMWNLFVCVCGSVFPKLWGQNINQSITIIY